MGGMFNSDAASIRVYTPGEPRPPASDADLMRFFGGGNGMPVQSPGQPGFGPAPIQGQNPVAEQTQQMANNPIYGQGSPFQPPMPNPTQPMMNPNVSKGFGPAPIDTNISESWLPPGQGIWYGPPTDFNAPPTQPSSGGGKSIGSGFMGTVVNSLGNQLGNQIQGMADRAPSQQGNVLGSALANVARQFPSQIVNQSFQGGLRPAPRNYRPPVRSGGILRQRMR